MATAKGEHPESVAALGRDVTDRQPDAFGDVGLAPVGGAERHRWRHVQEEPGRQRSLGNVDPDVGHRRPGSDVPVDPPDVVTRLVRPDLGELGAAAQVVGPVLAGDEAPDPSSDGNVERAEERLRGGAGPWLGRRARPGQRRRGHADRSASVAGSAAVSCGAGTDGRIRSRIMSAETSSARAAKLGTIRWRRTSWASSVTSDGIT